MLAAAEANLTADVEADISPGAPRYQRTITVTQFNAKKLLKRDDTGGVIEGKVQINGVGTKLADIQGEADLEAQALQVVDWQIGTVTINGSIAQQVAK